MCPPNCKKWREAMEEVAVRHCHHNMVLADVHLVIRGVLLQNYGDFDVLSGAADLHRIAWVVRLD